MFLRRTREERRKNREEDYKQALQEVSEWNTCRLEAEARGEPFTEPMPGHDLPKRKKTQIPFLLTIVWTVSVRITFVSTAFPFFLQIPTQTQLPEK